MRCESCGSTGEGAFCAQCGARLEPTSAKDPSDAFWADDEPTRAATRRGMASSDEFPDYPWASGRSGPPAPTPGVPPGPYPGGPGQPPPPGPGSTPWPLAVGAAVAVALLVLGVGGGALWFLTSDDETAVATTDGSSTATSTSSSRSPDPTTTTVTTTTTSTTTSGTVSPEDRLGDLRDDSLTRLSTDGRWAVSLSAKQDGTRDDRQVTSSGSHVFRLPDILELHEGLETTYASSASVYLLRAEDLGSTKGPDGDRIWMTIVDPGGLSSRADAEQWCQEEFLWLSGDDLDNACYPRQLRSP